MTQRSLHPDMFPRFPQSVRANWAPLLLNPIAGSPECLVVGCVVANIDGFHLEISNSLERLNCLYGVRGDGVRFAIDLSVEALKHDLSRRGLDALLNPQEILSGVKVGETRDGEGKSLADIARSWLAILSSLHDLQRETFTLTVPRSAAADRVIESARSIALPKEVFQYVNQRNAHLAGYFSERLRLGRHRTVDTKTSAEIDFFGKKLVANFARISLGQPTASKDKIKIRLWDLSAERDRNVRSNANHNHELIVQIPASQAKAATEKQVNMANLAFENLEEDADKKRIIIRKFGTDEEIFKHILKVEMAA